LLINLSLLCSWQWRRSEWCRRFSTSSCGAGSERSGAAWEESDSWPTGNSFH